MKRLLFVLLIALLALGAGATLAQEDVDPSGQTIVYWHQYSEGSSQGDTIAQLVEEFNSTNEWGITVEALFQGSYNELRDLMNAAIISGELPNLVAGFNNDAASYARDGVVVDLNQFFEDPTWGFSEEERTAFRQEVLDANVVDGFFLAWPNQISANMLSVNLTMIETLNEMGLIDFTGAPETFEQFKALACAAANSGLTGAEGAAVQGYPIKADASNLESYIASFGGTIFDFEEGRYDFTTDAAISALQFYADLYSEGCAYIPDSRFGNTDDFALGLNPMALGSSAGLPFIQRGFENSGVEAEWIMTTTPWTDGNRSLNVFFPSIIMIEGTPEQNLASWLFLKFLAERDAQELWSRNTGYFAVNLDAMAAISADESVDPLLANNIATFSNPEINIYVSPAVESYGAIRGLLSQAVADVTSNGMDVEEVAERLTEEANEVHQDLVGD
ncbi:MAG: extracellular solute-binding protein [Chloroflexi bacterium]|nr:MAG: extracellular solute-binding protein [Chloroflexota bacterium]